MSFTKVSYLMIQRATKNVLDYGAGPAGATNSRNALDC